MALVNGTPRHLCWYTYYTYNLEVLNETEETIGCFLRMYLALSAVALWNKESSCYSAFQNISYGRNPYAKINDAEYQLATV